MKFKHFSFHDGRTTNVAYMNGYSFGDRMLEGIAFKVEIVNGDLVVNFAEPNGIYEQTLDQKYWLEQAQRYAEDEDIFYDKPDMNGFDLTLE